MGKYFTSNYLNFIVKEYAALGSLYEYLSNHTLDFKNILQWAKEIAAGMLEIFGSFVPLLSVW